MTDHPKLTERDADKFVLFDAGWSDRFSRYEVREIEKVTPKLIKLARGGYPGQIKHEKAVAVHESRDVLLLIAQSMAGIHGEYQRRCEAAERDCSARIDAAREAKQKAIARLVEGVSK
ncbi:hypothetical protein IC614_02920 [Allosphingosinicella flava]|uniref:Uncharacterized protein n=1 Tax=Allosphingosinicella flava TaxID=2771430 RepID=A0A7T2LMG2_9SPHN|nr:hypothetical protein [Sphingosinicella flava]QPQ55570.1 hypothetical protein IC614_02920 [Sphingosinicella flava]